MSRPIILGRGPFRSMPDSIAVHRSAGLRHLRAQIVNLTRFLLYGFGYDGL